MLCFMSPEVFARGAATVRLVACRAAAVRGGLSDCMLELSVTEYENQAA